MPSPQPQSLLLASTLALALVSCAGPQTKQPAPPRLATDRVAAVRPLAAQAAREHEVPLELVLGVIQVESSFNPRARSPVGARGLMQLMPKTARSLARRLGRESYDVHDPEFNIQAGTAYLALLLRLFEGDLRLALAGYNTGPSRVLRWSRQGRSLPAYSRRYVAAVLAAREAFVSGAPGNEPAPAAAPEPHPELDSAGLVALMRKQQALYGERPDEPLPTSLPALTPSSSAAPGVPLHR